MKNYRDIYFEKASLNHVDVIFRWLAEPHVMEFWDNSAEHKEDILNFIHGRKQHYFAGTTKYWVGYIDDEPYCFILSDILEKQQSDLSELHKKNMSQSGVAIALDFGIGSKKYLGKGLAAPTLQKFIRFYKQSIDPLADTFFIDPDVNNSRAMCVYRKAGFKEVGGVGVVGGAFEGGMNSLMVKNI